MVLHMSITDTLNLLIDEFPGFELPKRKEAIHRKLVSILSDYHKPNSDATTREHFEGLEERCRVLQNEELADALVERYERLESFQCKWKYDTLSFLLQLEDNPVEKSRLDDLYELCPAPLPAILTWDDLLREDPYEDKTIWQNINYAESDSAESLLSHDSDKQLTQEGHSDLESKTENSAPNVAQDQSSSRELDSMLSARDLYLQTAAGGPITEMQLIRETISMLQGLPSPLYQRTALGIELRSSVRSRDVCSRVVNQFLNPICKRGTSLSRVRRLLSIKQSDAVRQSFQAVVLDLLYSFDRQLSAQEQTIIQSKGSLSTLLFIVDTVQSNFRPLELFDPLLHIASSRSPYKLLDDLCDTVIQLQGLGDDSLYMVAANTFFACVNTYLRPVKKWIDEGSLEDVPEAFFIKHCAHMDPATHARRDAFELNLDSNGIVCAPRFLRQFAPRIFKAGKGIHLLRTLSPGFHFPRSEIIISLDFTTVCSNDATGLQPFENNLERLLNSWTQTACSISEEQVLNEIKRKSKLQETLIALQNIYFLGDGAAWHDIASNLFDRIDKGERWRDRFMLTDLFQGLAYIPQSDKHRISVSIAERSVVAARGSVQELAMINLEYKFSSSAAIFFQNRHTQIFGQIFVLLLQLKRAIVLLDHDFMLKTFSSANETHTLMPLSLRLKLRWFVGTISSYLTTTVLKDALRDLDNCIQTAKDTDELVIGFDTVISDLGLACILADHQDATRSAITRLLDLVVEFCRFHKPTLLGPASGKPDKPSKGSAESNSEGYESSSPPSHPGLSAKNALRQHSTSFDQLLDLVISGIQETCKFSSQSHLQMLLDSLCLGVNKG